MKWEGWERLLKVWSNLYYASFFLYACLIGALIISLRYRQKTKVYSLFIVYIISSLVLIVFFEFVLIGKLNLRLKQFAPISESNNMIFTFIEFIAFYSFFYAILESRKAKLMMKLSVSILLTSAIIFLDKLADNRLEPTELSQHAELTTSFMMLFWGSLCILYYYELLFKKKPIVDLSQSPSFWIILGVFFYCFMCFPFFLIAELIIPNFRKVNTTFYAIHYTFFGFLFLTVARAMSLRKPLTE